MKRFFTPWLLVTVLTSIAAAIQVWRTGSADLLWVGALVAALPLPAWLIGFIMPGKVARTQARLPGIQALTAAGLAIALYAAFNAPFEASTAAAVAIAANGVAFVQWFVWVFSSYGREKSQQIVIGEVLPELPFKSLDGAQVSSSSFVGNQTLLVFFRANWCPLCMAQLKEIVARADRLKRAGVEVRFISNQGIEQSRKLLKKLDLPAHFEILQDDDLKAARILHIEDIGGAPLGMGDFPADTVMATVVALNEAGRVVFGDETDNYRVRPHPDTFLHVFEQGTRPVRTSVAGPGGLEALS